MTIKPFYVYRIFNITGTLYVGKGMGRRLADQKRTFGADGEILAEFHTEEAAFRAEKHFIRKLKPTEWNACCARIPSAIIRQAHQKWMVSVSQDSRYGLEAN